MNTDNIIKLPQKVDKSAGEGSPTVHGSPYALVTLESLTIKKFKNKDDWQTAMSNIRARGKDFIALKYHHSAGSYIVLERVE